MAHDSMKASAATITPRTSQSRFETPTAQHSASDIVHNDVDILDDGSRDGKFYKCINFNALYRNVRVPQCGYLMLEALIDSHRWEDETYRGGKMGNTSERITTELAVKCRVISILRDTEPQSTHH